jgi:ADP-ribosylation factor-like protein 8
MYYIANIDMARAQLHELLGNKSLSGIPLLVLGNKNDLEGAIP